VDEQVEQPDDLWRERADALVVARLLGQIGEQVPQPPPRERENTPVAATVQPHLRDVQADHLSVADQTYIRELRGAGAKSSPGMWCKSRRAHLVGEDGWCSRCGELGDLLF
jgi:hypothetical protein